MIKLVLFDIDGTLLDAGDLSWRSFLHATKECLGRAVTIGPHSLSGKTDPQIIRELLLQNGAPSGQIDQTAKAALESYQSYYLAHIEGACIQPLEGASELMARLSDVPQLTLGLLTGNIEAIIVPKLEAAGLPMSCFALYVCGSDDADRANLPALALGKAERLLGIALLASEIAIVGDTPLDIACAKDFGAVSIAVATGEYTHAQLRAAGPTYSLRSLLAWREVETGLIDGNR